MRSQPVGAARRYLATPPKWRMTTGRALMWCACASAVAAAATGLPGVTASGPGSLMAETWRLYGFLVFAALFALLAYRPLGYRWVWEIVIVNKLLLAVTAGGFALGVLGPGEEVSGAVDAAVADGLLVVVAVLAYVLCRGWRAGPRASTPE
ncbi:hypothetical protein F4561_000411 [Lipingzhangella halophila]|uniref:Uncharacterized protein n=1 Tax=Lipingzhangella halophila TaxID=1783352 RepID=A0A7W7RDT8_9ACTN|nr:hypothetical protein [Lipingzhangella halophila]MBB4929591.1 hypothetical protein [Lipingzhangella halophila]